jgi:hypothetical protein
MLGGMLLIDRINSILEWNIVPWFRRSVMPPFFKAEDWEKLIMAAFDRRLGLIQV